MTKIGVNAFVVTTISAVIWIAPSDAADCTIGTCACGDTIPAGSEVTLSAPLTGSPCSANPAITVAGGATLNLAGITIECDGTGNGILMTGEGAKLRNGSVLNCLDGVELAGEGRHFVSTVSVDGNGLGGAGVGVGFRITSDRNKLFDNTAAEHRIAGFGLYGTAAKNLLRDNTASDGFYDGFFALAGTSKNKFIGNVANGQTSSDGFDCDGDGNLFKDNTAIGNASDGFEIVGSGNKLKSNKALGNSSLGFSIGGSGNHTLVDNVAIGNSGGISLGSLTDGSTVRKNRANNNTADGIWVGGEDNALKDNVALGNGSTDLSDVNAGCDNNIWSGNIFGSSDVGSGGPDPCLQ